MNRELKGSKSEKAVSEINELRDDYLERLEKLREEYKEYGQTSKITQLTGWLTILFLILKRQRNGIVKKSIISVLFIDYESTALTN